MTELVTEPDIYCPSIDENGNYMDRIPSFHIMKKGFYVLVGQERIKYMKHIVYFLRIQKQKFIKNGCQP